MNAESFWEDPEKFVERWMEAKKDLPSMAEERWDRAWRCQISYALNAHDQDDFDHFCMNAAKARAQLLMAQVLRQ